ncbi:MAG: RDD family protein [Helicobacteraceae bacterium]|jgi:uncharacterized RDD family membrane protein YckC|nr:RDD family protein [Helicobacteraceae bacterium]
MSKDINNDLARENLSIADDARRIKAFVLDEIIVAFVVAIALWEPLSSAGDLLTQMEIINSNVIFVVLFKLLYHTLFTAFYGATLGKMWQRIFVITADGFEKPPIRISFARASMRIVSELALWYGFLWAFGSQLRQTWHDKAANTIVINA